MHLNRELGIPQTSDYYTEMGYANAGGTNTRTRTRRTFTALAVAFPPSAVFLLLVPSAKKRAQEVMGSPSNPQRSKMEHYKKDIIGPKYPFNDKMPSETLAAIVDSLTKDYEYYENERQGLVKRIAENLKQFSVSPNREWIAQLQDVRGMMQVINDYRADVVKAYDKAFDRELKDAASSTTTTTTTTTGGSTTTGGRPTGQVVGGGVAGGALSPIPSMEQVGGITTTGGESGLQPLNKKKAMNYAIPALLVGGLLFAIYRYTR